MICALGSRLKLSTNRVAQGAFGADSPITTPLSFCPLLTLSPAAFSGSELLSEEDMALHPILHRFSQIPLRRIKYLMFCAMNVCQHRHRRIDITYAGGQEVPAVVVVVMWE
jgi:hypothetical protein